MSKNIFYQPAILPTVSAAMLGMVEADDVRNFHQHEIFLRERVRKLIDSQEYYESKDQVSNYLGDCLGCSTTDELLELIFESQFMSAFLTDLRDGWNQYDADLLVHYDQVETPDQLFEEVSFMQWLETLANYINN